MPTPQPPVDTDVKLPASVVAAGARADAIHKQAYTHPDPQPAPAPSPAPEPVAVSVPQPASPPAQSAEPPAPTPQPPATGDAYPDKAASANMTPEQLRHQYLSMKGRYEQATQSIGALQEQLAEVGDELMRTHQAVRQRPPQQPQPQPERLVTDEEIKTYGPELMDVITRAARQAVMPDMQNLHNGVRQVSQRVQQVSTGNLYSDLDRDVADWRAINVSPRFKAWCALRDIYSGQVRGKLLHDAFTAADAPRVVSFFKGFLSEEQATGQLPDPSGQPPVPPVARTPAMTLDSLVTPGRAHPTGGDQPLSVDKPIFTRAQIAAFYRAVRENQFAGREADKNTTEQAIFAAQREGRVRS